MLTVAMALLGRPRLLMIDELSLGLSPALVAQLRVHIADLRDRGHDRVVVVEQSVDLALGIADRAVLPRQGRGAVRGAGAATCSTTRTGAGGVPRRAPRRTLRRRPVAAASAVPPVAADAPAPRRRRACSEALRRASSRSTTCRSRCGAGEILGVIGPERRGQDHAVRRDLRLRAPPTHGTIAPASTPPRALDDARACPPPRARPPGPRPIVPGRPPLPRAHRRRDHRGRRASTRSGSRNPVAAALHLPAVARSEAAVRGPGRRAHRSARVGRLRRQVRARALHRDAPDRRPRLRARPRADRCSARRTRRAASRSARPRPWAPCSATSATRSAPACSWSSTTSRCSGRVSDRLRRARPRPGRGRRRRPTRSSPTPTSCAAYLGT